MQLPGESLPRSSAEFRIIRLGEVGSTNDEVLANHSTDPDFTVVVTTSQTAGRGRLGRVWIAPPGKTLAVSVLLRPRLPGGEPLGLEHYGWLPLIAGAAMATAVDSLTGGGRTTLKWPNDVQVDGRKISGLLAELIAGGAHGSAVVIGAGLNLGLADDELPIPTATSLAITGAVLSGEELVDAALLAYLRELRELTTTFLRFGADADASGILATVSDWCSTLGQEVRVELPGGTDLVGAATGIDSIGRLVVRRSSDGAVQAVAAGDVTHLRYE